MMDLIALGILIICFGCVKLFANLLLAGYLVYALIHPEKL